MMRVSEEDRLFGVSSVTIRNWVDTGRLKCRRLPSGVRVFDENEVNRVYQKYMSSIEGGDRYVESKQEV